MLCSDLRPSFRCEFECAEVNATHAELEVATQSYISRLDAGGAAAVAEPPRALALPPAADCKVQEARMRAHGPSWADAMAHDLNWQLSDALEAATVEGVIAARAERKAMVFESLSERTEAAGLNESPAPSLRSIWRAFDDAFEHAHGLEEVRPSWEMRRDVNFDFVKEGTRLSDGDVQRAARQLRDFVSRAPKYPEGKFIGEGIVVGGGGLKWMAPAIANIAMLRRVGCQLPVELWVPDDEALTIEFSEALMALGVTVRSLDAEIESSITRGAFRKFSMKAAAIVFSRFERVLWLDSDNIALKDPAEAVFASDAFARSGMVLWPDYWLPSWAPDLLSIVGVSEADAPAGTHESGQLAVDKSLHWDSLLVALYFNMQNHLYYPLMTDFMGMGDKETFPWAVKAVGKEYSFVQSPTGSAGTQNTGIVAGIVPAADVEHLSPCMFRGNTMVQFAPDAAPLGAGHSALEYVESALFLHTNYGNKFEFRLPADPLVYQRRWRRFMPGDHSLEAFTAAIGYDPERVVFDALVSTRCAPFFERYRKLRQNRFDDNMPVDMDGNSFHESTTGMNFVWWALNEQSGPYETITECALLKSARTQNATAKRQHIDAAMTSYLSETFDNGKPKSDVKLSRSTLEVLLALPEHMTAKLNGANPYIQRLNQLNQRTKELHDTIQSQAAERQSKGLISAALTAAGNARGASASKAHGGIAGAFVPSKGAGARAEGEGIAAGSERPE